MENSSSMSPFEAGKIAGAAAPKKIADAVKGKSVKATYAVAFGAGFVVGFALALIPKRKAAPQVITPVVQEPEAVCENSSDAAVTA